MIRRRRDRPDPGPGTTDGGPAPADTTTVGPLAADRPEHELWAAVQQGSTTAFGHLFDRHVDAVYRYAVVRLRQPQAAEEVVSVVFAEAWRQRHRIHLLDGTLRPWLLGVARNQVSRASRQQVRQLRRDQVLVPGAVADHAGAVAAGVDAERDLHRVLEAIDGLPEDGRETLVLHVWGELSHEQIALELGVSVGTVKSRLHRARGRLAVALDGGPDRREPADAAHPTSGPGGR